jgi:murein DD-endopeptidase MepM/ murein hydrolase activator NlpD
MIKGRLPIRGTDSFGSGAFGASRGSRQHNGIDFIAAPNTVIECYSAGHVTKVGYCYNDAPEFRYVQVTTADGCMERYFYIDPVPGIMDEYVHAGTAIGDVHSLQSRYAGITDHIHFEVKRPNGTFINPALYFQGYR